MAAEDALELLPIAALLCGVAEGGGILRERPNHAFRRLGIDAAFRQIEGRIATFLAGDGARDEFAWSAGRTTARRHFQVTLSRTAAQDGPRCLVCLVDQTSETRIEHSLRRAIATDSLTGLPNRNGFGDGLRMLIAERARDYAVLVVDLDRFSHVNACLGGIAADQLIITVARRVRHVLRASDVLARIGGDQFGVLVMLDADADGAEHVAQRIHDAFAAPFRLSGYEIRVACSIGIARGTEAARSANDVIRHAQFAVKRSKQSGQAEAYRPQAFAAARKRFAMETALRRAIEGDHLRLAYQPICDLATGRIVAFEALARWTDEAGHDIAPAQFIPVAEESGLIVPLGRWAIDAALGTLAAWDRRAGGSCGASMSVNLSPIQLQRDAVAPMVEAALAAHRLPGSRLKLELTESALIADPDGVACRLRALKALGATIAMDDFGTGFSNMVNLRTLPIDILKIDRSFVTGMLADRDKGAIVRAILGLADALGLATVAEGIETSEVDETLAALGCTYGQGYIYAPPLEADAAYALLVERNS